MDIKIENIVKKFDDSVVLDNISWEFKGGKLNGITGFSGSGKTTLLNIIGLLEPVNSGKIIYDNKNLAGIGTKERSKYYKKDIGFLFQNSGLVENWTVGANLLIGAEFQKISKKDKKIKIIDALNKVGLSKDFENKKVYKLSGGEQQRVALARLLVKDCSVILCDEPSAALDDKNTQIVVQILKDQALSGKTIIISTHDPIVINQCNEILNLK